MRLFEWEFAPFRDFPGWYVSNDPALSGAEWTALQELAQMASEKAAAGGWQLFCGRYDYDQPAHLLFAIKEAHPCELVRLFRVGSHNRGTVAAEDQEVACVYDQMRRIYEIRPFRPYFVDGAGYHCKFVGRITSAEAEAVEEAYIHGGEWYSSYSIEQMALQIVAENALHLWWD